MAEFNEELHPRAPKGTENGGEFIEKNTLALRLIKENRSILLNSIKEAFSVDDNKASEILNKITDYADANGETIYIEPNNNLANKIGVEKGLTNKQLQEFYQKHGFEKISNDVMKREPKDVTDATTKPISEDNIIETNQTAPPKVEGSAVETVRETKTKPEHEAIDKAVKLFYDIKDATKGSEKRQLAKQRQELLSKHPEVKRIFDNAKTILTQLQAKGIITKTAGCP